MDFPPYNIRIIIYKSNESLDKFWRNKAGGNNSQKIDGDNNNEGNNYKEIDGVKIKVKEIIRKFLMEKIMAKGIILTKMIL